MTASNCSLTAIVLLAATLAACAEEGSDESQVGGSAPGWGFAGSPAPAPEPRSSSGWTGNTLVDDSINSLLGARLQGTYSRATGAYATMNGQLRGAFAFSERYFFSPSGTFDSCLTQQLIFPERHRDSGRFTILDGAIRFEANEAGTSVVKFNHNDNFGTIWLDGKEFVRTPDAKLCD